MPFVVRRADVAGFRVGVREDTGHSMGVPDLAQLRQPRLRRRLLEQTKQGVVLRKSNWEFNQAVPDAEGEPCRAPAGLWFEGSCVREMRNRTRTQACGTTRCCDMSPAT